jgi:hypothetical protein
VIIDRQSRNNEPESVINENSQAWYMLQVYDDVCMEKNDPTRWVTHRHAVFASVFHSIFDTWHYQVVWTSALTRLLCYTCNYVRLILAPGS